MKKWYNLSTQKTAVAIPKINNCLPVFPLGLPASKFTDQEVVGLLEWSLPLTWRKKFDLDGLGTKAKLILEFKAIEQNESVKERERGRTTTTTTIITKKQVWKFRGESSKK
jgi:hypothetical protein